MSNLPFGFQPPSRGSGGSGGSGDSGDSGGSGDSGPGDPQDPFSFLLGGGNPFGGQGPQDLGAAMHRFADLLSWSGGPVNWDLARDVALTGAREGDRSVTGPESTAVGEALRLADLWLEPATTLPAGMRSTEAWTRVRWVEATLPVWSKLCDPVAGRVVEAMAGAMPAEVAAMAGPLTGVFRQLGGAMFGTQVGQALGQLAGEVLSSTDVGLPLGPDGVAALVPANVAAFGSGLGVPEDEVRLYLALREAAHHRLFGHVPWLRSHLLATVEEYARGISVDLSALEQAVGQLDPSNPEALQEALAGGLFEPQQTDAQQAALGRLETALALVEGWVDEVVDTAAAQHLPHSGALRETVRRRRASGGPAEQTFATLVGLELRPRRLREAAALWRALRDARGIEGRDDVWSHPDLMPGTDDLDDPRAFLNRSSIAELDLSTLTDTEAPAEPPGDERGPRQGDAGAGS